MNIDQERRALELLNEVLDIPRAELTAYLDNIGESDEVRTRLDELLSMDTKTGDLNIDCHSYIQEVLEKANLIDKQIGAYRIVEEIGRGGMGGVFRGRRDDGIIEKDVAIKIMDMGLMYEKRIERFRTEQKILANMVHPYIAKLLDAGIWENKTPYIIMELIEGLPINEYCKKHKLSLRKKLILFQKVCHALQYAHGHLIVHRDLKPANILVTNDGEPKLLDFGIAKLLDNDTQLTQTHAVAMTPMYASPEQLTHKNITVASDIYSMGLLLCELLTDNHPFKDKNPLERLLSLEKGEEIYPSQFIKKEDKALKKQLTGDLDNLVRKAMKENPSNRYISAQQLADDVGNYLNNFPLIAEKTSYTTYLKKFLQRHTFSVAMITSIFAIIVTALVITNQSRIRAEEERDRARYISTFLEDIFAVSDPYYAKKNQRDITAKALLDKAYLRMNKDFSKGKTQAELLETIGWAYYHLDPTRAESLLKRALEINENELAKHRMNERLGYIHHRLGNLQQSISTLKATLASGVEDDESFIQINTVIGHNLFKQGKHEEAVNYFLQAIERHEKSSHTHAQSVIESYGGLAIADLFSTNYKRAWDSLQKGLLLAEKNNLEHDPSMHNFYFAMAAFGVFTHRAPHSITYAEKGKLIHESTGRTWTNTVVLQILGLSYYHVHHFDKMQKIIQLLEKKEHPSELEKGKILHLKALHAFSQGEWSASEAFFWDAQNTFENLFGKNSVTYQALLGDIACFYEAWGCEDKRNQYLNLLDQEFVNAVSPNSGLFLHYYHLLTLVHQQNHNQALYKQSYEHLAAIITSIENLSFAKDLTPNTHFLEIKASFQKMEPPK